MVETHVITYTYDNSNRLKIVNGPSSIVSMLNNGLGDRMQQTVDGEVTTYVLDLVAGLTQVLSDGDSTYLYGVGRIGEYADNWAYHHSDALGSIRQLTDESGVVTLAKSYQPYGDVLSSAGSGASTYGFTGEMIDVSGLVFLRARYYATSMGRFLTQDPWSGDYYQPMSYNAWLYVLGNPINLTDPSGLHTGFHSVRCDPLRGNDRTACEKIVRGLSPNAPGGAMNDFVLLDRCSYYGNDCHPSCERLEEWMHANTFDITKYLGKYNATFYGYWFHYLMNIVPGSWNNYGKSHPFFRDVVSYALGAEMRHYYSDEYVKYGTAEAFARKAWGEGFYRMIGGRQSVQRRVNIALYGDAAGGDAVYPLNIQGFNNELINDNCGSGSISYSLAGSILYKSDWHRIDEKRPYEWANLTKTSSEDFIYFINTAPMTALGEEGIDGNPNHAIWYAYDRGRASTLYIYTFGQSLYLDYRFPPGSRGLD